MIQSPTTRPPTLLHYTLTALSATTGQRANAVGTKAQEGVVHGVLSERLSESPARRVRLAKI